MGQGVRQGGILSTDLYKVYGNGHTGEICCVAPTCADDLAAATSSLTALQRIVFNSVDYSIMER